MSRQGLRRALRHASKENRLGAGAKCQKCGEADVRCLRQIMDEIWCDECRLALQGKPRYEWHHSAGKHNDRYAFPMRANEHAIMSDFQADWPEETLRNPNKDPLLWLAAWRRANHDFHSHQAEMDDIVATLLEDIAEFWRQIRPDWPEEFTQLRERKDHQ